MFVFFQFIHVFHFFFHLKNQANITTSTVGIITHHDQCESKQKKTNKHEHETNINKHKQT